MSTISHARPRAVVTGASSGIGAVFARKLAQAGFDPILVARRRDRLEQLSAEITAAHGAACEILEADLCEESGLKAVEDRIGALSDLEYLINNAGFGSRGRFFETGVESQTRMHRLHVLATVRLTHAVLPGMVARRSGNIVNVSSVAGFIQSAGNVSYCATKAWMNSFTEGLYLELKSIRSPVRVQALCPGFTYSEFHDVMGTDRSLIPKAFWLQADDVVDASLSALRDNRLFAIPKWRYRAFVKLFGMLPRKVRHAMGQRTPASRGLQGH